MKPLTIARDKEYGHGAPAQVNVSALFDRLPDDIVLSVSTRDLELSDFASCLCAWVLREQLARALDLDADDAPMMALGDRCAVEFGGLAGEWETVIMGVISNKKRPVIELAWTERVDKAVRRA